MSIDMGLPAFGNMAATFGVSIEHVSQTLSVFFFGFSVSPLIYGPLSDRVGRRPVLLSACFVYAAASILATMTSSFGALLFWRLFQGAGAGAASVLAITVIRDHRQGASARRLLSYAAVVRIIAPTTAPSLGNLLLLLGSWRWIYGFMALGGIVMSIMVALGLPESSRTKLAALAARALNPLGAGDAAVTASDSVTTPTARTQADAAAGATPDATPPRRAVLKDYRLFLSDKLSLSYVLIVALTFSSHFSYVTGSLYVFVNVLHVSTTTYGLLFGVTALCLMAGSFLSGQFSKRDVSSDVVMGVSLCVSTISALTMLTLSISHLLNVPILALLLSTNALCLGMLTPSAQQGAMENAGEYAGTASALMNAITTGMGACAGYLEGLLLVWFNTMPAVVMTGLMTLCCGAATVLYFKTVRPAAIASRTRKRN
jgi:DHA1 family bicyclomycin/chloramphenicol resistance-like MFS transporter